MAKTKDNSFRIKFENFQAGLAPLAHIDPLTEIGNGGHATVMTNCNILNGKLTQGPGLVTLTNGTEAGAVTETIGHILAVPVASSLTYGISNTKLYQITPTAVTNAGSFPHTITNATNGQTVAYLNGNIYYFYNKVSGGDIGKFDLASTFTDNWGSTVPSGAGALQSAIHPVATKQDLMVFGNGQYVGTYFSSSNALIVNNLDFGTNNIVSDIAWHSNYWYIAVNSSISGSNSGVGEIYLWDGSALCKTLADESSVGLQRIGFLYPLNGQIYVAYQDMSFSGGYSIGVINGRSIKQLGSFSGSLPTFAQKTLYNNTILFLSGNNVYSSGAIIGDFNIQMSQIASAGYTICGAMASPFGNPMIASTDGLGHYKLAQFSGYDTNCVWKSIITPTAQASLRGYIDKIMVLTEPLGAGALANLTIEANQATLTSSNPKPITGTGLTSFTFDTFGLKTIEDFRCVINNAGGSVTNPVKIRKIFVRGHWVTTT